MARSNYTTPWATGAAGIADMVFAFDEAGRTALYYTLNGNGQLRKIVWNGQVASPTPSNLAFSAIAPTRAYDTRSGLGAVAGDVRSDTTRLVDLPPPSAVGAGRARQHHGHEQRRVGVPGGLGAAFVAPAHVGGQRRAAG